jgi:hypothetical protein
VLQAAPAQANGVQSVVDAGTQWPTPSQAEAALREVAVPQTAGAQGVVLG